MAAPGHVRGCGAHLRPGRDLPAGQARRPDGQRTECRHPDGPGLRCGHRLRLAARRPISRRAAPPRGPARGHVDRAAPSDAGDHRQRAHRGARHDVPGLRRHELHGGPGPGGGHRHRRRAAGDDHPAAGVPGDLRPLDLLAATPVVRHPRAERHGLLGPGGRPHRAAQAAGVDRDRGGAGGVQPRRPAAQRARSGHGGRLHQGLRLRHGPAGPGQPRSGRHLDAGPGRRQRRPGAGGRAGDAGYRRDRRTVAADRQERRGAGPGQRDVRPDLEGGVRDRRPGARCGAPGQGCRCPRRRRIRDQHRHRERLAAATTR